MSSPRKLALWLGWSCLAACSEHARDTTRIEPIPDNPPLTRVNAERPAPAASGSPGTVSSTGEASDSGAASTPGATEPMLPGDVSPPLPMNRDVDCQAGAERCNGARAERCSGGSWKLLQICAQCNDSSYCRVVGQGASCFAPFCCFPETRCDGDRLLRCNTSSTGFELLEDCGVSGARCDVLSGKCLRDPADSGAGTQ